MNKCKIYVEGIADQKFIIDYINYHYDISMVKGKIGKTGRPQDGNLIEIEGKDNLHAIAPLLDIDSGKNITNIIIFDADSDILKRKQELQNFKNNYKVDFDFFLFPNNKDKGELEDLLVKIINQENNNIFECWDKYETCIRNISTDMTLPNKKAKIYAYLEPFHGETKPQKEKINEANRDYKNKELWDLDVDYLTPLKIFLDKYFAE